MSKRSFENASKLSNRVSRRIALALMFCAMAISAPIARAQVLYGALTGTVTDSSGAVIVGAVVTAVETLTGVSQTGETDSAGIYRFSNLSHGTYKVTINAKGFATQETPGITVTVNETRRLDASLKTAGAAQEVIVTTAPPLLQTDSADVHTTLTAEQLDDLPTMGTQGRNVQSVLRTIPGAGLTAETNSLAGNPQRAINTNMNGQSNQSINTRLDGVLDAYPWLPANVAYVPPADGVETMVVTTNSFDPEQGMAGGAAVNIQMKSGTNQFHGSGVIFHTDQSLAARNYFLTDATIAGQVKKNRNNQYQYGGTFGGPILRNKLFFFGDFERTTQRQLAGPDTRTLPTAAMATGDFRNLPGNPIIYDPATGAANGSGKQQISCNGVLNTICPNRLDFAATAMVKLLQPSIAQEFASTNGLNNFVGSGTALFNRNNGDIKINYIPTSKTTVFGRYSISNTLAFDPPLLGGAIGDATNGGQLGTAPGRIQQVGVGATHTFSPTVLLDWNFGYTRQKVGSTFGLESANGLNDLKIPGTNGAGAPGDQTLYNGYPGFQFTASAVGANVGNVQTGNPFLFRDNQYVTGANLTWVKGKHSFRGGLEWDHTQLNHFQPQGGTFQQARGAFQFNGNVTSLQGSSPTWFNSWADFMLGLPVATGKARALFNPNALRWTQWAWYLEDHYQFLPSLTLTFGLRWEYYPFGYSDNGKGLRYFNLNTGNVLIGGYGNVPVNDGIDVGHGIFMPRVGVNYRMTSSTVIRAGYGISADPNNWRYFRNAYPAVVNDNNVPAVATNFIPAASLTGTNATGLGSGSYSVPTGIVLSALPNLSSGVIPLPTSVGTTTIPNPFRRGYLNSYNLTVEQEWRNYVLTLGYVGNNAIRPLVNLNANASAPGTNTAGGLLSTAYTQQGLCSPCNYTGGINALTPFKNTNYNSMQLNFKRRYAQGSAFGLSYTWSRAIDYSDNEELTSLSFPYPAYWEKNRAAAGFDRTNNLEIWGLFVLPFGPGQPLLKSGAAGYILGGWRISPIVSNMSGVPFTVAANGSLGANGSSQTADLVGKFKLLHGRPPRNGVTCAVGDPTCHYFDPTAFAAPLIPLNSAGVAINPHYGNTNRNEFRGPGYFNMNLSINREFKIKERVTLGVRADAFSLTNTPHFANPALTCPASATAVGPVLGSGGVCNTGTNNNFGVITGTASPGGFFGPDGGNRTIWYGANVKF
jgi:Carboxypeptidase regulatory-like domain/TonB dependent receptor